MYLHTQQYLLPQTQQPRIVVLKETHTFVRNIYEINAMPMACIDGLINIFLR